MSTGQPALASMLDDVSAIIRSLDLPERRIVLFGRSLGSLYAVHGVFRHPQVAGLILESGIANIAERFFLRVQSEELGMPRTAILEELQRHFDYAAKLTVFRARRACSIPGTTSMVHVYHAEMLYAAAPEPKTLHIFDQGGTTIRTGREPGDGQPARLLGCQGGWVQCPPRRIPWLRHVDRIFYWNRQASMQLVETFLAAL